MRVLFLCTGNSCRSQMAEGWLRALAGDKHVALSAGTRPQGLNPGAISAMADVGIDIAQQTSDSIDELLLSEPPDLVISVCDHARESCPTLPGSTRTEHWPFDDPADATGSPKEIASVFARVRDEIKESISHWLSESLTEQR